MITRIVLPLALVALGCEVEGLDVGGNAMAGGGGNAGSVSSTGGFSESETDNNPPLPPMPPFPSTDGCETDVENLAFTGVWEGSLLNTWFDPIMPVRLEINGASESGGICGSMLFGASNPPALPTDPDAEYSIDGWSRGTTLEGFTYTIYAGGAQGDSLHLGLNGYEPWKSWCELQPPVFNSQGEAYRFCVAGGSPVRPDPSPDSCTMATESGPVVYYPQQKCGLCAGPGHVCECRADGCSAVPQTTLSFSLVLDENDEGTATLTGPSSPDNTLLLERVE